MLKIGTLFSGVGTPEFALTELNIKYQSLFACEINKYARLTYLKNHKTQKFYHDIHELKAKIYKKQLDLLIGGSPCQSFSLSGLRYGTKDNRGKLIYQFYRVIEECLPKAFIYENVKGFTSIDKGNTLKEFVKSFELLGYTVKYKIMNTANYSIPQSRERIYIVGYRDNREFEFPKEEKLTLSLEDFIEENIDSSLYLNKEVDSSYKQYKNRYISCAQRGRYDSEGNIYQRMELRKDNLSYAITTVQKDYYIFDGYKMKFRKMSVKEAFSLQGFTNFKIDDKVSQNQLIKQAGNAMSLNVIKAIIKELEQR